jgi:hypothetical protein
MPEMKDIAETETELEDDAADGGEDTEGGDDKGNGGLDKQTAQDLTKTMQGLNQTLKQAAQAPGGTEASNAALARDYLIKKGFKEEDLADLGVYIQGEIQDSMATLDKKSQNDRVQQFRNTVFEKGLEEADKFFESVGIKNPSPNMRAALVNDAGELMQKDPKFANALAAFQNGRVPLTSDFVKAIQLAGRVYGKGAVTMKDSDKGAPANLDTKNSKTKAAASAVNDKGEVDLTTVTDLERQVYTDTLNVTKNKDIALHALKTIAPKLK